MRAYITLCAISVMSLLIDTLAGITLSLRMFKGSKKHPALARVLFDLF